MQHRIAIISVHPHYAEMIISGAKRVEFRRSWAAQPISTLVIYATSPVQRIVAVAEIKEICVGSPFKLWDLAKNLGGGLSRSELFTYLNGKSNGVAIELTGVRRIAKRIDPAALFGKKFKPPQSFRYLKEEEYIKLGNLIR